MSRKNVAPLTVATLLIAQLTTACEPRPSDPLPPNQVYSNPPVPPVTGFPQPTRAATIYLGQPDIYQWLPSAPPTRFVFYEDSSFALQFAFPSGLLEYAGHFARTDSAFDLRFDGASAAGPWIATGALRGDTLSVTYNVIMMLSDFSDGKYVLVR